MPMEAAKITDGQVSGEQAEARVEFLIGGNSSLIRAQQEAREFSNSRVFQDRSAIFPNPLNFGIKIINMESSTAHKWEDPPSPMNQFYVQLILVLQAPNFEMIEKWVERVNRAIKVFMPAAYGTTTERASHLQDTGRTNPVSTGVGSPGRVYTGMGGDREAHLQDTGIAEPVKEGAQRPASPESEGAT